MEFWLRRNLKLSENNFRKMQKDFGYDTIWKCLSTIIARSKGRIIGQVRKEKKRS